MDSKYSIHVENVALQVPKLQPSIIFVSTELHSPQHARLGLLPNRALRRFSWAILPWQKNARWDHENIRTFENLQNDAASGFFKRKTKRKKPKEKGFKKRIVAKNRVPAAMGGELVKGEMPPWRRCF